MMEGWLLPPLVMSRGRATVAPGEAMMDLEGMRGSWFLHRLLFGRRFFLLVRG